MRHLNELTTVVFLYICMYPKIRNSINCNYQVKSVSNGKLHLCKYTPCIV